MFPVGSQSSTAELACRQRKHFYNIWGFIAAVCILLSFAVSIWVSTESLRSPLSVSDSDPFWFYIICTSFLAIALTFSFWRGRLLLVFSSALLVAFVLAASVVGNAGASFLALLWIILLAVAIGNRLLYRVVPRSDLMRGEVFAFSALIGFGLLSLLTFAVAALQILYPAVLYLVLLCLSLIFLPRLFRTFVVSFQGTLKELSSKWRFSDLRAEAIAFSVCILCALGSLIWAVAPTIHFDDLNYHLGVPSVYLRNYGMMELTEEFRSYWVHYAEMLYTLGLGLTGQPLPSLIHFSFGVLVTVLIFTFAYRIGGRSVALFSIIGFYSLPLVSWEAGTAYNELVVTGFAFAAIYSAVLWWDRDERGWLVLSGAFAGFALGSKLSAVFTILPLSLLVAVFLVLERLSWSQRLKAYLSYGIPLLLFVSPWILRDWLWTGNPIFPFYNKLFQSHKWFIENTLFNFGSMGAGHSLFHLILVSWHLTVKSGYLEVAPAGIIGPIAMVSLPWFYLWPGGQKKRTARLAVLAFLSVLLWFKVGQLARFLLPILPVLCVLAAINFQMCFLKRETHLVRATAVLFIAVGFLYTASTRFITVATGWRIPERFPYRVAFGLEDESHYLSRTVSVFQPFQFMNQQFTPETKVLSIGNDLRMYTHARIYSIFGSVEAGQLAVASIPSSELARRLVRSGFNYFLVDSRIIKKSAFASKIVNGLISNRFARLIYSDPNLRIYRVNHLGFSSQGSNINLLRNPGFEAMDPNGVPRDWNLYGNPIMAAVRVPPHSGQVAVRADSQSGVFQYVSINGLQQYKLGHWMKADTKDQFGRLQINWLDSQFKIVDVSIIAVAADLNWKWNEMYATAPEATIAQVYASVHENSRIWFDDFQFVKVE